ncbi:cleavage and polyadenylation specificity factor subunit 3-like [Xenia sp. Carnegie-2017]|uniref:cleavage and polyadenylation specificity factor subunit 3-like n=1 Tax=Xenia sp. Carnegie-2017 TaxID=2897299 RepID=UPI001F04ACEE|nr:cleavage and polyadenylation specificity factor subunit 3-like [Xenia sp. Carnegie-2017]
MAESAEESDLLRITPLGAGQEVGRSCHILEFKGKKVMLDFGIHPGYNGLDSLPFVDEIDAEEIDLLLISHFHLDHCGGLPWFLEKTTFNGRVFMTHPTKAIYRWLLSDFVKVSNMTADQMLFTEKDLEKSMDKIETVHFHEEKEVNGVKFWCYHAGHVLGAAMFMIEIAGVKILYTGDFSREEDRHLMAAEIPNVTPDILITESTYGTHVHEPRGDRETRFTNTVHDIVNRGGRCLIPVFALGRAQELLLILDEYWQNHPELHDIPIYYASSLAKKCMSVYQTYIEAMNERIRKQISISNPFVFKHISNLKNMEQFDDIGPSVVMASPGMMQSGLSRELFELWCTDRRNGVVIAGYCVEGTLAKSLMTEPEEVPTMAGQKLPRKCSVDYISFSAHTDYEQTSEFIRILEPPHIVLVHGEHNEMGRLKAAIIREYEDKGTHVDVYNPANCQSVELYFRGEKMAKVMGSLASEPPSHGKKISGLLIKRGFNNYHLIAPDDLHNYTDLATSLVTQRQIIAYHGPFSLLYHCLMQLTNDIELFEQPENSTLKVFNAVTVTQGKNCVIVEWIANAVNDMYADAILTVILQVDSNPTAVQMSSQKKGDTGIFKQRLVKLLKEMFGHDNVTARAEQISVRLDEKSALINTNTKEIKCDDDFTRDNIQAMVNRLSRVCGT